MRVLLLHNPVSGRGRAARTALLLGDRLRTDGHEVGSTATETADAAQWLTPRLRDQDLLVVIGGDGAVRLAARPAASAGVPIVQIPMGTENLFARAWGMRDDPEALCATIARGRIVEVDIGDANGRPFLLMASVGFDAEVVHDLAAHRRGPIRPASYLAPIARQLFRWRPRPLTVRVDGEVLCAETPGFLVVGNTREYGWRFDPALRADMTDGQIDAVFFPARTRRGATGWAARCRLHRHVKHPKLVYRKGQAVTVESDGQFCYQIDGDPPGEAEVERLELTVAPGALRVLVSE